MCIILVAVAVVTQVWPPRAMQDWVAMVAVAMASPGDPLPMAMQEWSTQVAVAVVQHSVVAVKAQVA